jgi:hypothetical protein
MRTSTILSLSFFLVITAFLSCSKKESALIQVPFDGTAHPLKLSEIVENSRIIKLETTDSSLININYFRRAFFNDDYVVIAQIDKVFLFDGQGNFLRTIGRRGQGPGEFTSINATSVDFKNERIYLSSPTTLLCYDMDGNFIEGKKINAYSKDICLRENQLWMMAETVTQSSTENIHFRNLYVFKIDSELNKTDSIHYRSVATQMVWVNPFTDSFLQLDGQMTVYCYEGDYEGFTRDTLTILNNDRLMPFMKLDMSNASKIGSDGAPHLMNIYRSKRYAFAVCFKEQTWFYCYDTKEHKSYFQENGFTDDLYNVNELVLIRASQTDTNCIYYLTPDSSKEEANYMLVIGILKK